MSTCPHHAMSGQVKLVIRWRQRLKLAIFTDFSARKRLRSTNYGFCISLPTNAQKRKLPKIRPSTSHIHENNQMALLQCPCPGADENSCNTNETVISSNFRSVYVSSVSTPNRINIYIYIYIFYISKTSFFPTLQGGVV